MLSTVALIAAAALGAQRTAIDAVALVDELFARQQAGQPLPHVTPEAFAPQARAVLARLRTHRRSEEPEARHLAYSLIWQVGLASGDRGLRRDVTARLLEATGDPAELVSQHAATWLVDFERLDFTPASRAELLRMLDEPDVAPAIVRAVGSAGIVEALPALETLVIDETTFETGDHVGRWYGTVGWSARLARARLGVREDLDRAIELIDDEPDAVIRVTHLLRHLAYTGQPKAYEYIATYLASPERLPPLKPGNAGMPAAQYAIDTLAHHVSGFPVAPRHIGGYSDQDFDTALRWMDRHP